MKRRTANTLKPLLYLINNIITPEKLLRILTILSYKSIKSLMYEYGQTKFVAIINRFPNNNSVAEILTFIESNTVEKLIHELDQIKFIEIILNSI